MSYPLSGNGLIYLDFMKVKTRLLYPVLHGNNAFLSEYKVLH